MVRVAPSPFSAARGEISAETGAMTTCLTPASP